MWGASLGPEALGVQALQGLDDVAMLAAPRDGVLFVNHEVRSLTLGHRRGPQPGVEVLVVRGWLLIKRAG